MSAKASCKFPLVDAWKNRGDRYPLIGFLDSVLSGFAQIAFSDNPFCGLLLITGAFLGSPRQALSCVWATCLATLFAYGIGVPKTSIRMGLYSFNAALAGLGIPIFAFSREAPMHTILLYASVGAIVSLLLTAAFSVLFSRWNIAPMALPYCLTLLLLIPASLLLPGINHPSAAAPLSVSPAGFSWTIGYFYKAAVAGLSQVLLQAGLVTGFFYLLAVLVSSRIDAAVAVFSVCVSTLTAVLLHLPPENITMGLYGYNAVLLSQVLFGRAYRMNVLSFLLTALMSVVSVIFCVAVSALLAPLGAPTAGFPYVLITIPALLGHKMFSKLTYISPSHWGVPETIEKALRDRERVASIQRLR